MSRYIDADKFEKLIRDAPTVDVEPIRHGTWLTTDNSKLLECSRCGEIIFFESTVDIRRHYRYCHRCGAKMDKE